MAGERLVGAFQRSQRNAAAIISLGERGRDCDSFIITRDRIVEASEHFQGIALVQESFGIARTKLDGLAIIGERIRKAMLRVPHVTAIIIGLRGSGIELYGPIEAGERLVEALQLAERDRPVQLGAGIIRLKVQSLVETGHGLIKPLQPHQGIATVIMGFEIIGRQRERLIIMADRFLEQAQPRIDRTGHIVENFAARVTREQRLALAECFGPSRLAIKRHQNIELFFRRVFRFRNQQGAKLGRRALVSRKLAEDLVVNRFRGCPVSVARQDMCFAHCLIDGEFHRTLFPPDMFDDAVTRPSASGSSTTMRAAKCC
ncbi:MAG TPA: hypothetical protein VNT42_12215 [Sphingomonas sp.]|nr:hypothetical protein [Sphingomonas sp.]